MYNEYDNGLRVSPSISKDNFGWLISSAPELKRLYHITVNFCKLHTVLAQSSTVNPLYTVTNFEASQFFLSEFSKNI